MMLRELAHARAGDKGNISNVSVIAYDPANYPLLCEVLTPDRIKSHFVGIVAGDILRYELPQIGALNFVMYGALNGGVTKSLALDPHGKCLSSVMLEIEITFPTQDD
jgi:hypothetical protein